MFKDYKQKEFKVFISNKIEVKNSDIHGWGVFAKEEIGSHEIVEVSPVIIFDKATMTALTDIYEHRHILMDYPFGWTANELAFSLGWGGLYNHSKIPNLRWNCNYEQKVLEFRTLRKVKPGEELVSSYVPRSLQNDLWF